MSDIFFIDTVPPGTMRDVKLASAQSSNASSLLITIPGNTSGESVGFITDFTLTQKTASQFQQSLDQNVYALSFGDQVGSQVMTIMTNRNCAGASDGLAKLLSYYDQNKISPTKGDPLNWVIASSAFTGFLVDVEIAVSSQNFVQTTRLHFAAWHTVAGGSAR